MALWIQSKMSWINLEEIIRVLMWTAFHIEWSCETTIAINARDDYIYSLNLVRRRYINCITYSPMDSLRYWHSKNITPYTALDFAINKRKKPRTLFYISHCHKKHRNCKKLSYGMLVNRHLVLCFQREFLFFREISLKLYNLSIKKTNKNPLPNPHSFLAIFWKWLN